MPGGLHRTGNRRLLRVALLAALIMGAATPALADETPEQSKPRIATVDWGQAQTLTAIGAPPVAAGQLVGYRSWVGGPDLPSTTRDIGLRAQPNMELLAQIAPDVITLTTLYGSLEPRLAQIAPAKIIDVYGTGGDVWANTIASTRALARLAERTMAGERLIADSELQIAELADRVQTPDPPVLVVQFMDARHVRVYGEGSLIKATLERLGIGSAWTADTTQWGFALVPIERLAEIGNARMVVMGPVPVGVVDELQASALWQNLPSVDHEPVYYIDAVWSFGGLPSATRFARLIVTALNAPPAGLPVRQGADS